MRRLLPGGVEEPLTELYLDLWDDVDVPEGRPFIALSMIMSVDGAVSVRGTSGALGGEADGRVLRRLRERADAILVGAETVRSEAYGTPTVSEAGRRRRRARGQTPVPRLVIVTGTGRLDLDRLTDPDGGPLIVAPEGAELASAVDGASILRAGEPRVDLSAAVRVLRRRGIAHLLCEGGPSLGGQLVDAGLVDELLLTVAPVLGGDGLGMLSGSRDAQSLTLLEAREHADELLLRYRIGS